MKEKRTDMLVGIFLFVGLLVLGGIIIRFGSFSENFREKYALTLTYPDAGGIVKGSDVRLGGAKIGRVARTPYLQPDATGVVVDLEIYNEYRIPENATFHVAVSGLLGDSYISIRPPKVPNGEFIKPGAEVAGKPSAGFDTLASTAEDLSRKGEAMLDEVRDALKDLNSAIEKLDQGILGEENIKRFNEATLELATALHALNDRVLGKENIDNLRAALANLRTASVRISEASEKLEPGIASIQEAAEDASAMIDSATTGSGILPAMLNDPSLRNDLTVFLRNLREHGVLRYKDESRATGRAPSASAEPDERKKRNWLKKR